MSSGTSGRGSALVSVVLLLLVTTLLAMGALHLARAERVAAAASARESRHEAAVEGWVAAVLEGWAARLPDSLPREATRVVEGARLHARLEALSREWVLARGWAVAYPPGAGDPGGGVAGHAPPPSRHARVAWSLDPGARVATWTAAVEYGGALRTEPGATILPPGAGPVPGGCGVSRPVLDSLVGTGFRRAGRRIPLPDDASYLGPLGLDELAARLDPVVPGRIAPTPSVSAGACLDAYDNWGSPSDSTGPCGARWVGLHTTGDLAVAGGEGQGVWVVEGDLVLGPGTRLRGLLLVGGSLRLEPDARIHGLVRSAGGVVLRSGARIEGAFCPAARALAEVPGLRRPLLELPGSRVGLP